MRGKHFTGLLPLFGSSVTLAGVCVGGRSYVAFAALSWACFQHASALNHHQNKNHSEDPECPSDPGIQNSHAGQLLLLSAVLPSFTIEPVGILWKHPRKLQEIAHSFVHPSSKSYCLVKVEWTLSAAVFPRLFLHSEDADRFHSSVDSPSVLRSTRDHGPSPRSRCLRQASENSPSSRVALLPSNSRQRKRRSYCSLQTLALRR